MVLSKNYSFTEKVNSIQQLFAYCLLTGTEVDIGEIIYSDLATRLTNKSRQKSSPTILRLPSTQLDDGTRKSQLLPKDKKSDPKDSVGNKEPIDTRLPSTVSDEGTDDKYQANQTQSARLRSLTTKMLSRVGVTLDIDITYIPRMIMRQTRADLLKALNGITEILKAIQEAVKEDPVLNNKSLVETVKATLDAENDHLATWAKSSTSMV
ncbi:hypothetical protein Tco_0436538 [Tanacetum coccineum]